MERKTFDAIDVRLACQAMAVETRGDQVLEQLAGERIRSFAFVLRGIIDREARRRGLEWAGAPRVHD